MLGEGTKGVTTLRTFLGLCGELSTCMPRAGSCTPSVFPAEMLRSMVKAALSVIARDPCTHQEGRRYGHWGGLPSLAESPQQDAEAEKLAT